MTTGYIPTARAVWLEFANGWCAVFDPLPCGHFECARFTNAKAKQFKVAGFEVTAIDKDDLSRGPVHANAEELADFIEDTRRLASAKCRHDWRRKYSVFTGDHEECSKCGEIKHNV